MSFRFFRRINIAPGVSLNLSKGGASVSVGPRGAKLTAGTSGKRATLGLPGSGLFYTTTLGKKGSRVKKRTAEQAVNQSLQSNNTGSKVPELGFFKKLITPQEEQAFILGLQAMAKGENHTAIERFIEAEEADALAFAGLLALNEDDLDLSIKCLGQALEEARDLGRWVDKYRIHAQVGIWVTEHLRVQVAPDSSGLLLALAEAYQANNQVDAAIDSIRKLAEKVGEWPPVVRLSLLELLLEKPSDTAAMQEIVEQTAQLENEDFLHAAMLGYKAEALEHLGLYTAARDTYTQALRRKKDRPQELLDDLKYRRACLYEKMGNTSRARQEFEALYAQNPHFEDVATRLSLS